MNETLRTIAERYSCRDFSGLPLTDAQIQAIAEAAVAAPSARNHQPWHVIIITDKAFIDGMDKEGMRILAEAEDKTNYEVIRSRGGRLFYNAPCMVVIASSSSKYAAVDCGILSQNIALASHSLGLGSVICAMAGIPLSGPSGNDFKERLLFPKEYEFGMAVLVGTAKSIKLPHELDMTKVTYITP